MSLPARPRPDVNQIVAILAEVIRVKLRARCEMGKSFAWLKTDAGAVVATAYFPSPLNCLFAFDPADRLTPDRGRSLQKYPANVPLGFDYAAYIEWCAASRVRSTARTRRRALEDEALDLLPLRHGLNPTLRIAEPEMVEKVAGARTERKLRIAVEGLLDRRLGIHGGTTFLQLLAHPSGKPDSHRPEA